MAYRDNVHPDQHLDGVIGWNSLLDSQLPTVLWGRILGAFVDAEGALEPQNVSQITERSHDPRETIVSPVVGKRAHLRCLKTWASATLCHKGGEVSLGIQTACLSTFSWCTSGWGQYVKALITGPLHRSALSCEMLCPGFPSDSFCPEYSVPLSRYINWNFGRWRILFKLQATTCH